MVHIWRITPHPEARWRVLSARPGHEPRSPACSSRYMVFMCVYMVHVRISMVPCMYLCTYDTIYVYVWYRICMVYMYGAYMAHNARPGCGSESLVSTPRSCASQRERGRELQRCCCFHATMSGTPHRCTPQSHESTQANTIKPFKRVLLCLPGWTRVEGYLAHKNAPPRRTLQ